MKNETFKKANDLVDQIERAKKILSSIIEHRDNFSGKDRKPKWGPILLRSDQNHSYSGVKIWPDGLQKESTGEPIDKLPETVLIPIQTMFKTAVNVAISTLEQHIKDLEAEFDRLQDAPDPF